MIVSVSLRNIKVASVLLSLLLVTSIRLQANGTVTNSEWEGTGLGFGFLEERVNTHSCSQKTERFLACIAAVQSLLDLSPGELQLTHAEWLTDSGDRNALRHRFGDLVVLETTKAEQAKHANILELISAQRQRILVWQRHCRTEGVPQADFTRLLAWARKDLITTNRAEEQAAAAINAYLGVEDAHARIVPAVTYADAGYPRSASVGRNQTGQSYSGIGASVQSIAGHIMITRVLPEGPAAAAGLQASDVLLAIDGKSIAGRTVPEVVAALRGASGTAVSLRVKRQERVHKMRVRRAAVEVKNVSSSVIVHRDRSLGYLHIDGFVSGSTCAETRRELRDLIDSGVDGLVLDLRDNMGGKIDQAVCVADLFLEPRQLVMEIRSTHQNGHADTLYSLQPAMTRMPVVTLVNAGTASASEALAGALQDHGRSLTVGERTFGKGTIQRVRPWNDSGSVMLFFTTARMFTPSGRTAQLTGLEPDLDVQARPDDQPGRRMVLREEDLFPTALSAKTAQTIPVHSRVSEGVRECLEKQGQEKKRWFWQKPFEITADYQLDKGYGLLHCLTETDDAVPQERNRLADGSVYPRTSN
jgi:carboxyl-terminal processing protease